MFEILELYYISTFRKTIFKGLNSVICFCLQEAEKFPKGLDDMEWEINSVRAELKELKAMHNDAQISKEAAQSELANQEKAVYHERKLREVELQKMKKEAEDKKMQHERIDRRIVRI